MDKKSNKEKKVGKGKKADKTSLDNTSKETEEKKESLYDYEHLLENAFENMPKIKLSTGERFQIPELDVIIEGNKTIIKNFQSICEKVRRDVNELALYFKKELGAPVTIQETSLLIHKKSKPEVLKKMLESYIQNNVLCAECKRPDTKIVTIQGTKFLLCEACGARRNIRK